MKIFSFLWRMGLGLGSVFPLACSPSESTCRRVHQWVLSQHIPPGEQRTGLTLPAELADAAVNGKVDVSVSPGGRVCLLLKTSIGYKDNYHGMVWCDAPVAPEEIKQWEERRFLSLGNPPLEELYVKRQRAPHWFEVYFDLN